MTNVATALYSFWSSFSISAYVEDTVPENAQMPYITYRLAQPDWDSVMSMYARVWYRSTSFTGLAAKVDQISRVLDSGYSISGDGFYMALMKDSNFCQYMPDSSGDGAIKTAYLSLIMHVVEV